VQRAVEDEHVSRDRSVEAQLAVQQREVPLDRTICGDGVRVVHHERERLVRVGRVLSKPVQRGAQPVQLFTQLSERESARSDGHASVGSLDGDLGEGSRRIRQFHDRSEVHDGAQRFLQSLGGCFVGVRRRGPVAQGTGEILRGEHGRAAE
jgi:hypothetical protein